LRLQQRGHEQRPEQQRHLPAYARAQRRQLLGVLALHPAQHPVDGAREHLFIAGDLSPVDCHADRLLEPGELFLLPPVHQCDDHRPFAYAGRLSISRGGKVEEHDVGRREILQPGGRLRARRQRHEQHVQLAARKRGKRLSAVRLPSRR
jgi:hypothetical protein